MRGTKRFFVSPKKPMLCWKRRLWKPSVSQRGGGGSLSDPKGTDLTVAFNLLLQVLSRLSKSCSNFGVSTHISYIVGKRRTPRFIRTQERRSQRQRQRQRQIQRQRQRRRYKYDPTCAIFLKSLGHKGVKYDILITMVLFILCLCLFCVFVFVMVFLVSE